MSIDRGSIALRGSILRLATDRKNSARTIDGTNVDMLRPLSNIFVGY